MALSFGSRQRSLQTNVWPIQRQPLIVRKQNSFIENGRGRGMLTKGLSVGRSYDGIRHKLNATGTTNLRSAGSYACLRRQTSIEQDFKLRTNSKQKDAYSQNSKSSTFNNFSSRLNYTRRNTFVGTNNCENLKIKEKSIVAWSSTTSLFRSDDEDEILNGKKQNFYTITGENKLKGTRKASTTSNPAQQRLHSSSKVEVNKINLNIVLPQDNETFVSDLESSLDSGVNADNPGSPLTNENSTKLSSEKSKQQVSSSALLQAPTTITTSSQVNVTSYNNSAVYKRTQFRGSSATTTSYINATTSVPPPPQPPFAYPTVSSVSTSSVTAPTVTTPQITFSASPSLTVLRRPPLVRAMSAPVRPIDDNSKGNLAASKRKPRRRRIIARNVSCDKSTEEDFITSDIINGKKILTRSRSAVASEVITLVSLMSSEGSDSEREDIQLTKTANSKKSESSPARRAPLLRKTGKSVSFQENYPPNFQLASKEYSHMIRRGSIAPLTARFRTNRPPTAPAGSIFLNMSSNTEPIPGKDRDENFESSCEKRTPMVEKAENKESIKNEANAEETPEYIFPDYVRSIKEKECWKLYQKMCNKGVNVSYDTILRGMLTPTEFRQIQKQRELEEAKEREAEAANESENVKPPSQSAIDRLSEALLKK